MMRSVCRMTQGRERTVLARQTIIIIHLGAEHAVDRITRPTYMVCGSDTCATSMVDRLATDADSAHPHPDMYSSPFSPLSSPRRRSGSERRFDSLPRLLGRLGFRDLGLIVAAPVHSLVLLPRRLVAACRPALICRTAPFPGPFRDVGPFCRRPIPDTLLA